MIKGSKLNCEDTTELNATWLRSALKRDWLADKPMQEAITKGKLNERGSSEQNRGNTNCQKTTEMICKEHNGSILCT